VVEFCKVHFPVSLFVVEFEAFHVVIDITDVLVLLHLGKDWKEFVHLQLLLI